MYDKILIAPFDYSGNPSRPYRENGWLVIQVDIKLGLDFLAFDIESLFKQHPNAVYGIIAPMDVLFGVVDQLIAQFKNQLIVNMLQIKIQQYGISQKFTG